MIDTIFFSPEDLLGCKTFAAASKNDNYGTRNQNNAAVKQRQIYQGKLGEVAAHRFLQAGCPKISAPDFNIYPPNKKNWKPDLACGTEHFHVKTMGKEQAEIYGLSWTFQFSSSSGKGGKDTEIFGRGEGNQSYIVFTEVDLKTSTAAIFAVLRAKRLFDENLFRDPKLDHLKGIKKCVYHADLESAGLIGKKDHDW